MDFGRPYFQGQHRRWSNSTTHPGPTFADAGCEPLDDLIYQGQHRRWSNSRARPGPRRHCSRLRITDEPPSRSQLQALRNCVDPSTFAEFARLELARPETQHHGRVTKSFAAALALEVGSIRQPSLSSHVSSPRQPNRTPTTIL